MHLWPSSTFQQPAAGGNADDKRRVSVGDLSGRAPGGLLRHPRSSLSSARPAPEPVARRCKGFRWYSLTGASTGVHGSALKRSLQTTPISAPRGTSPRATHAGLPSPVPGLAGRGAVHGGRLAGVSLVWPAVCADSLSPGSELCAHSTNGRFCCLLQSSRRMASTLMWPGFRVPTGTSRGLGPRA